MSGMAVGAIGNLDPSSARCRQAFQLTSSSIGQQFNCQSSQRMRCNQGDHAVATEAKPVHPVGQPIRASTNAGFKVRRASEVSLPATFITRTWRPSRPFTGVFANVVAPSL
jgi:hypothetical protein